MCHSLSTLPKQLNATLAYTLKSGHGWVPNKIVFMESGVDIHVGFLVKEYPPCPCLQLSDIKSIPMNHETDWMGIMWVGFGAGVLV